MGSRWRNNNWLDFSWSEKLEKDKVSFVLEEDEQLQKKLTKCLKECLVKKCNTIDELSVTEWAVFIYIAIFIKKNVVYT